MLFVVILPGLLVSAAMGQALQIVSTDPPEDATDVPLHQVVTFNLSKPTPTFGSGFTTKFTWSPTDSTVLTIFGHDFDDSNELTIVFFTLDHTPASDFAFFVYGVEAADGSTMTRPFALNYSTAAVRGTASVSGTVAFGERGLPGSAAGERLVGLIRTSLLDHPASGVSESAKFSDVAVGSFTEARLEAFDRATVRASSEATNASQADDLRRTVVLLLEQYDLNEERWQFTSAAVPDDGGTFSFDQVRDGAYFPVALNFADETGTTVGAYAFYDPDGDLEPDSTVVVGSDVSGIPMTLFPNRPFSVAGNLPFAHAVAARFAEDQVLVDLRVLSGPEFGLVFDDGSAMIWRYMFFSPSLSRITVVAVDPINFYTDTFSYSDPPPAAIPELIVDSDEALQIADDVAGNDFRAMYPGAEVGIFMQAGDLDLIERPYPGEVFWKIEYRSPDGFPEEARVIFVDIESGQVLPPSSVATEDETVRSFRLLQNYPNPFNPSTTIDFEIGTGGPVRLDLFDVLGRRLETLHDGILPSGWHSVTWTSGNRPSGVYLYRLESAGRRAMRSMTLLR
jgi:hypothetical protein